uniref:PH domain-containing protein n=1 Tax=Branchiostoma floridae TaxID=7739 RepID=C3ZWH8_BRAFL|eukprot:XP_002587096.1 hypothetical protein BRAFLDRAFT_102612 [Branchiostoma floridae]
MHFAPNKGMADLPIQPELVDIPGHQWAFQLLVKIPATIGLTMSLLEKLFHLRGLTGNRPTIDQHGLFTSIQMSKKLLSEKLAVKEPWRLNKKPHQCKVCLYTNDSSPFLVCYNSSGHRPRARIELYGTKVVTCGDNSFKLCNEEGSEVYFFQTDGRSKRDEWVRSLKEQCERELSPDGEESVRLSKKIMEI